MVTEQVIEISCRRNIIIFAREPLLESPESTCPVGTGKKLSLSTLPRLKMIYQTPSKSWLETIEVGTWKFFEGGGWTVPPSDGYVLQSWVKIPYRIEPPPMNLRGRHVGQSEK